MLYNSSITGHPDLCLSYSVILPLLKFKGHLKHLPWLIASCHRHTSTFQGISFPSLTRSLMFALYSCLSSILKSQICMWTCSQKCIQYMSECSHIWHTNLWGLQLSFCCMCLFIHDEFVHNKDKIETFWLHPI